MMDLHPNTPHSWLSHSNGKLIFKPPTASDELSLAKRSSCEFVNNADDKVDIISFRCNTRLSVVLPRQQIRILALLCCKQFWLITMDVPCPGENKEREKKQEHLLVLFFIPLLFSVWFQLSELSWIELISSELICPNVRTIMLPQNCRKGKSP